MSYCPRHSHSPIQYRGSLNNSDTRRVNASSPSPAFKSASSMNQRASSSQISSGASKTANPFAHSHTTTSAFTGFSPVRQQTRPVPDQRYYQPYVSSEGISNNSSGNNYSNGSIRAQDINRNKLRLEIEAREQELKLLAQMDYLVDLIKTLDEERQASLNQNQFADSQDIEKLKASYTNFQEELRQSQRLASSTGGGGVGVAISEQILEHAASIVSSMQEQSFAQRSIGPEGEEQVLVIVNKSLIDEDASTIVDSVNLGRANEGPTSIAAAAPPPPPPPPSSSPKSNIEKLADALLSSQHLIKQVQESQKLLHQSQASELNQSNSSSHARNQQTHSQSKIHIQSEIEQQPQHQLYSPQKRLEDSIKASLELLNQSRKLPSAAAPAPAHAVPETATFNSKLNQQTEEDSTQPPIMQQLQLTAQSIQDESQLLFVSREIEASLTAVQSQPFHEIEDSVTDAQPQPIHESQEQIQLIGSEHVEEEQQLQCHHIVAPVAAEESVEASQESQEILPKEDDGNSSAPHQEEQHINTQTIHEVAQSLLAGQNIEESLRESSSLQLEISQLQASFNEEHIKQHLPQSPSQQEPQESVYASEQQELHASRQSLHVSQQSLHVSQQSLHADEQSIHASQQPSHVLQQQLDASQQLQASQQLEASQQLSQASQKDTCPEEIILVEEQQCQEQSEKDSQHQAEVLTSHPLNDEPTYSSLSPPEESSQLKSQPDDATPLPSLLVAELKISQIEESHTAEEIKEHQAKEIEEAEVASPSHASVAVEQIHHTAETKQEAEVIPPSNNAEAVIVGEPADSEDPCHSPTEQIQFNVKVEETVKEEEEQTEAVTESIKHVVYTVHKVEEPSPVDEEHAEGYICIAQTTQYNQEVIEEEVVVDDHSNIDVSNQLPDNNSLQLLSEIAYRDQAIRDFQQQLAELYLAKEISERQSQQQVSALIQTLDEVSQTLVDEREAHHKQLLLSINTSREQELATAIEKNDEVIRSLQWSLKDSENEKQEIIAGYHQKEDQVNHLLAEVSERVNLNEILEAKVRELTTAGIQKEAIIDSVQVSFEIEQQAKQTLIEELQALCQKLSSQESHLADLQSELQKNPDLEVLLKNLDSLQQELNEVAVTRKEEQALSSEEKSTLKSEIEFLNNEIKELKEQIIESELKREALTSQNSELNETNNLTPADQQVEALSKLAAEQAKEIERISNERDLVKAEFEEILGSITMMETNVRTMQEQFHISKQTQAALISETTELRNALQTNKTSEIEVQATLNELKQELNFIAISDTQQLHQHQQEQAQEHQQSEVRSHHSHRSASGSACERVHHKSPQQVQFHQDTNEQVVEVEEENDVDVDVDDCDQCLLQEVIRQNEALKQQLLMKERDLIELRTMQPIPFQPARSLSSYGGHQSILRSPSVAKGKGQIFMETNDSIHFNRQENPIYADEEFESPPKQQLSNASHLASRAQPSSGSKTSPNYSALQNEIDHLQRIFEQKCKEVESWKRAYSQINDN